LIIEVGFVALPLYLVIASDQSTLKKPMTWHNKANTAHELVIKYQPNFTMTYCSEGTTALEKLGKNGKTNESFNKVEYADKK
jgi:hypothetical protein